jgi:hypothetical protein
VGLAVIRGTLWIFGMLVICVLLFAWLRGGVFLVVGVCLAGGLFLLKQYAGWRAIEGERGSFFGDYLGIVRSKRDVTGKRRHGSK